MAIPGVVSLIQNWQRNMPWLADEGAHLERNHVPRRNVRQALPGPRTGRRFHGLDPVGQRALDAVAARRRDEARRFLTIDEELCRLAGSLIGGHPDAQVLPAVPIGVTEFGQARDTPVGRYQSVPGQASRWREQAGLGVAVAVRLADPQALLPGGVGVGEDFTIHRTDRPDPVAGVGVFAHDPLVPGRVALVAVVRAHYPGQLGRALVRRAGHVRRDRGRDGPATVGVVGVPGRHQQRAEVGVADTELAVGPRRLGDLLGREVREADRDVHRGDDQLGDLAEPPGVERVVCAEELQQVDAGQVAGRVVQVHVLRAGVARGDPAGLRAGVPVVDGAVVLDARVGAVPGRLGHLAQQPLGPDPGHNLAGTPGQQVEVAVVRYGPHELVRYANGVVGVLVLDADDVLAAQVHVEPGVAQDTHLLFLARLRLDEFLDVRVVDIEDHHLGRSPGGAAGLDRAGRGIGPAHEGDRAAGGAAGAEQFLAGPQPGQVDSGPRATLEDQALFPVPLQDGIHGVVHGQDEARGNLLRRRCADVEPDRRVEAEDLMDEGVLELVLEHFGVGVRGKVTVLPAGLHVDADHPVNQLLEAPLPLRGTHRTAEVLGRDDVGGVDGPEVGELDTALLEVDRAIAPVRHEDVAALPGHLVVGVDALRGVDPADP